MDEKWRTRRRRRSGWMARLGPTESESEPGPTESESKQRREVACRCGRSQVTDAGGQVAPRWSSLSMQRAMSRSESNDEVTSQTMYAESTLPKIPDNHARPEERNTGQMTGSC